MKLVSEANLPEGQWFKSVLRLLFFKKKKKKEKKQNQMASEVTSYPVQLSHHFVWDEYDQYHGYSPKCKDCGTCDHYVNDVLDIVYFQIFCPTHLLCETCDPKVLEQDRDQYVLTKDMKAYEEIKDYHNGGACCLACKSESIWAPRKRICKSCYLQLSDNDRTEEVMTVDGFGIQVARL